MGWTRKSYDAIHDWVDPAKRERAEKTLEDDGLGDVIGKLKTAQNMGVWYGITCEAAEAVGESVIAASAVSAEKELSQIAATLGRKGRAVNSDAQKAAARENGKKGGRPKSDIPNGPVEWTITEGPDVYLIKITGDRFAVSCVNGKETGRFQLSNSEVGRILKAKTSDEAFSVLEE